MGSDPLTLPLLTAPFSLCNRRTYLILTLLDYGQGAPLGLVNKVIR